MTSFSMFASSLFLWCEVLLAFWFLLVIFCRYNGHYFFKCLINLLLALQPRVLACFRNFFQSFLSFEWNSLSWVSVTCKVIVVGQGKWASLCIGCYFHAMLLLLFWLERDNYWLCFPQCMANICRCMHTWSNVNFCMCGGATSSCPWTHGFRGKVFVSVAMPLTPVHGPMDCGGKSLLVWRCHWLLSMDPWIARENLC